ncbi:MAG: hypothetical protein M1118_10320, partial [Chloroflexi bacterium]|nr:hypothetical protein [Chloroflexota bacterium]
MSAVAREWFPTHDEDEAITSEHPVHTDEEEWALRIPARTLRREEEPDIHAATLDSLAAYLAEIGTAPLLTPAQEISLGRRAQAGDR